MGTDYAQPPTTATRPRRTFGTAVLAATIVIAASSGFGAGWVSHTSSGGSGSGGPASSATSSAAIAVHGTLTVPDSGFSSGGTTCSSADGYQDISAGVAVTIGDQAGKTLAVTSLTPGHRANSSCQFDFAAQVPTATTYTVTISHRGTQTFASADIAGGFNMTLNAN